MYPLWCLFVRWTPVVVVSSVVLWFTKRRTPRGVHVVL